MKKLLFILITGICQLTVFNCFAQAPNAIPYQGVARNAAGNIIASQPVSLRISIHDGTAAGTVVYSEIHNPTTTPLGLFNVNIGSGTIINGTLAAVDWGSGAKFLQVEMDATGGSSYNDMGTTQLNSVPYALLAGTSQNFSETDPKVGSLGTNYLPKWNGSVLVNSNITDNNTNVSISKKQLLMGVAAGGGQLTGFDDNHSIFQRTGIDGTNNVTDICEFGSIRFYTNGTLANQTQKMIINSSGNVGIGTSSPSARLDVAGNIKASTTITAGGLTTAGIVTNTAAGLLGTTATVPVANGGTGSSIKNFVDLTTSQTVAGIKTWSNDAIFDANVGIGMNPTAKLEVNGDAKINGVTVGKGAASNYYNTVVGNAALNVNTSGVGNSAFGVNSLTANTTGTNNTGLGLATLQANTSGSTNTAVGLNAMILNTSGSNNNSLGVSALGSNTLGNHNTAMGLNALYSNTTGNNNTAIGNYADVSAPNLTNATAIGYNAKVGSSNSLVLGDNANVGIGTSAPVNKLDVEGGLAVGATYSGTTAAPTNGAIIEGKVGIGTSAPVNKLDVEGGLAVGATYSGSNAAPTNGAIIEGRVGIGTATPQTPLHIVSTATNGQILFNGANVDCKIGTDGVHDMWLDNATLTALSSKSISFKTAGVTKMIILGTGNVGIGQTSPQAPLHVSGTGITTPFQARTYFALNTSLNSDNSTSGNILIRADGWFWANGGGYIATSDKRIKNIIGATNTQHDLETLASIKITDYKYIDEIRNGSRLQKKVIAQQLKEVYPDAVNQNAGVIPNVYETAQAVKIIGATTIISTRKKHGFKTGDIVKLVLEKGAEKELKVTVMDEHTFKINEAIDDNVFVYGKKIDDLLNVDYDAVSMLNVSATQELYKIITGQQAEIAKLKAENEKQTNATNARLKALEEKLDGLQTPVSVSKN